MSDTLTADTQPIRRARPRRGDTVRHITERITGTVIATSGHYVGIRFADGGTCAFHENEWVTISAEGLE